MSIETIKTLDPVFEQVTKLQPRSLVVFDVGDVILQAESRILRHHAKKYREALQKEIFAGIDQERHTFLWSKLLLTEKRALLDTRTAHLLEHITHHRAHALALTSIQQGRFGLIENMEDWRIAMLASLGIDFSTKFNYTTELELTDLAIRLSAATTPRFKKGVLFSYKIPKGLVLNEFLEHIQFHPTEIMVIDDQQSNLETIELISVNRAIPFHGFHYLPDSSTEPHNEEISRLQFAHLAEHGVWITEKEAQQKLPYEHHA